MKDTTSNIKLLIFVISLLAFIALCFSGIASAKANASWQAPASTILLAQPAAASQALDEYEFEGSLSTSQQLRIAYDGTIGDQFVIWSNVTIRVVFNDFIDGNGVHWTVDAVDPPPPASGTAWTHVSGGVYADLPSGYDYEIQFSATNSTRSTKKVKTVKLEIEIEPIVGT